MGLRSSIRFGRGQEWRRDLLRVVGGATVSRSVTGFVLAGGRSRRMGRDKALAPWGEVTLLDHALDRLRGCCHTVRILSGPERRYDDRGWPADVDVVSKAGALGGIVTGLALADAPLGLFLAVDMPRVPEGLLARLVALAVGYDAVVPVSPAGPEPLCAVYRTTCEAPIRKRLREGDLRAVGFLEDVKVRWIGPRQVRAWGEAGAVFANLNTPEDLEAARRDG